MQNSCDMSCVLSMSVHDDSTPKLQLPGYQKKQQETLGSLGRALKRWEIHTSQPCPAGTSRACANWWSPGGVTTVHKPGSWLYQICWFLERMESPTSWCINKGTTGWRAPAAHLFLRPRCETSASHRKSDPGPMMVPMLRKPNTRHHHDGKQAAFVAVKHQPRSISWFICDWWGVLEVQ